ncbi:MAG: cobalamin-independent methionine synthase II family protein [Gammaproteobacteria bacterium]|nr:cobalamin-independent methionine synthase II family protein [Gammaproteobacteria bacterium]NNM01375.1 cobalamin-independent methionine synthase II family protein [Gammaproteobacteria bacterium]
MATDRILTTHTGSLPRPEDLIQIMWAKGDGIPIDEAALSARVAEAVTEVVDRQIRAGLSIVNDGEMSKPSYATYVKDRLGGFGGESVQNYFFADLADYPRSAEMVAANPGRKKRVAPACNAAITVTDPEAAKLDMVNLMTAMKGRDDVAAFSSAASPGVITVFFANEYYASDEEYVFAVAEAMRHEYEAIAAAGATVQLDCPDLAMGRHTLYADMDTREFRKRVEMNIAALNHGVRNIPAEQLRMHLCWGNYPGPHHCDVPMRDIIDLVWQARPQTVLFEAANPRHAHEWELFKEIKVPDDKILCPGVIENQSNYIEHPETVAQRIERYANLVGRERVMAGVDCGFSVHVGIQGIDPDVGWAKLAALADGAAIATDRLWG